MPNNSPLHSFYTSKRWRDFRRVIIGERNPICEICGKTILDPKEIEVDHIKELTIDNIYDANITLNPNNVRIACHDCHNKRHHRFSRQRGKVFIVYGAPLSGKATYVRAEMERGDIVIDLDAIAQAISYQRIYDKPNNLRLNVFAIRDLILDNIKTRMGKWNNAWVIGGYPEKNQREALAEELGAELIYCEATKEECIERLMIDKDRCIMANEYKGYIEKWFDEFTE